MAGRDWFRRKLSDAKEGFYSFESEPFKEQLTPEKANRASTVDEWKTRLYPKRRRLPLEKIPASRFLEIGLLPQRAEKHFQRPEAAGLTRLSTASW